MKLDELFLDTLKDIYFAERQILKALPKMTKAAQEPKLKEGFTAHREETQGQVERLQQVFEILGKRAQGKTCETITASSRSVKNCWRRLPSPVLSAMPA